MCGTGWEGHWPICCRPGVTETGGGDTIRHTPTLPALSSSPCWPLLPCIFSFLLSFNLWLTASCSVPAMLSLSLSFSLSPSPSATGTFIFQPFLTHQILSQCWQLRLITKPVARAHGRGAESCATHCRRMPQEKMEQNKLSQKTNQTNQKNSTLPASTLTW